MLTGIFCDVFVLSEHEWLFQFSVATCLLPALFAAVLVLLAEQRLPERGGCPEKLRIPGNVQDGQSDLVEGSHSRGVRTRWCLSLFQSKPFHDLIALTAPQAGSMLLLVPNASTHLCSAASSIQRGPLLSPRTPVYPSSLLLIQLIVHVWYLMAKYSKSFLTA